MKVTIRDVAKRAGVSAQTVSRVLNNMPHVSKDVKIRVGKSIDDLGYAPAEAGKRLASMKNGSGARTGNIGCVLYPEFAKCAEPAGAELLDELGRILLEMNLHQYFCYTLSELADPGLYVRMINSNVIDGCVIMGLSDQHLEDILKIKERVENVVLVGCVSSGRVPSVHPDAMNGGYLATMHLISLGHRRIGCIAGRAGHYDSELRFVGYKNALEEAGIPFDTSLMVRGNFSIDGAAEAAKSLLKLDNPPTAVFSVSDPMAIGAYKAIQECGLQIPGDISVAGFDNIELAAHLYPELTTIGVDNHEMMRMAVQVLIDQIEGRSRNNVEIMFPVRLVERNSTRRLS